MGTLEDILKETGYVPPFLHGDCEDSLRKLASSVLGLRETIMLTLKKA